MAKKGKTITNAILAHYFEINETVKALKEEQDGLKEMFKLVGSFETKDYKMSVSPASQRQMVSIEEVAKAFKVTEKKLDQMGLIRKTEYETVRVTKKNKDE